MRLVLITPRFWPHTGDLESTAKHLSVGLAEAGAKVTVLTGSWSPEWPRSFPFHGVTVDRVAVVPRGGWSTFRYVRAISRWLLRHRDQLDLVYAMNLRNEAYAALTALRDEGVPIVLRSQDCGPNGDVWWQARARLGNRIRRYCQHAHAIVVPSTAVADELESQGYERSQLHVIPLGTAPVEARSADRRFRARSALAEVNSDLAAAEYAPVALFVGRLDDVAGLSHLVNEWQPIAARWPSARLWLVGDGPARDALCEQVIDCDLRYQTFLPGAFEDWSDLFQAADVLLSPSVSGRNQILIDAMAAGLPVIAADSPDLRAMMEHGQRGLLVPPRDPGAWASAISRIFEAPRQAAEMGAAASKMVMAQFVQRHMVDSHWDLFDQLLRKRSARES